MYKNLIGLQKLNAKSNAKNSQNAKKLERANEIDQNDVKSESSSMLLIDDFNSNNDFELDEFNEYLNENSYLSNYKDQQGENEDNENDDEDEIDNFDPKNDFNDSSQTKPGGYEYRLDLINEINDELLGDDRMVINDDLKSLEAPKEVYDDEEDEEEDDEDDDENSNVENINLNNLRISIDEVKELVDKSNKTCNVFVIQVWNLQIKPSQIEKKHEPNHEQAHNEEMPSWCVKRKYDEFYVLDTKLKEFHGGLISNSEYNINNPNQITVQLPPKQRGLFLAIALKIWNF